MVAAGKSARAAGQDVAADRYPYLAGETSLDVVFPDWAAEQGLPRYVILELVIDREGRLREAKVLNNVHPTLGEQAVAAVRKWIFEPALDEGEPVDVFYNVTVQFDADGDGGE